MLIVGVIAAAGAHQAVARYLANDQPNDGKLYQLLATNLLVNGVFSADAEPPFTPTLIRLPGYPVFLAFIYRATDVGNNTAVREAQAALYTIACGIAALIAAEWTEDKKRLRRKAGWWTFFLGAFCPFTVIYSATILTEVDTILLFAVMVFAATSGLKTRRGSKAVAWWAAAGVVSGMAVMIRPDSGLFALGIGLTIAASVFWMHLELGFGRRVLYAVLQGTIFSVCFAGVLLPWTIRNEMVFGVFQPLAPAHAEAPGEYVTIGYFHWLRTWIDDQRYIEPMLWNLEEKPIDYDKIPAKAFRNDDESSRVKALIEAYNTSDPELQKQAAANVKSSDSDNGYSEENSTNSDGDEDPPPDEPPVDEAEQTYDLKITPENDAEFERIADERVSAGPFQYYVELPVTRAVSMWFDTHSAYYPFSGELSPLKELDGETYQNVFLPIFTLLMWLYTIGAAIGAILLMLFRNKRSRLWLFLAIAVCVPRAAFFATLENPEPRYFVEFFLVVFVLCGILFSRFNLHKFNRGIAFEFFLPRKRAVSSETSL